MVTSMDATLQATKVQESANASNSMNSLGYTGGLWEESPMASVITIRNLDENTQRILKHRAVDHGRSFEAEIRATLIEATQAEGRALDQEPPLFAAARQFRGALREGDAPFLERLAEGQRKVPL